ncbi:MmcQ/YjbR family DNA-binding protein [Caulobacter vibrioides]|nr:MmcQ/YjbR family DNA-binding protein [Caulobacter vibrioides]ATC26195.1 hypothetical protein CA608_17470 [Caulobacter vibrioides]AZH14333.1 MmcQ/YjbR family DNA-binding protein [Caulobacter vibrioides]PLR10951.1 hypothetical protein CVUC_12810 [Caulobacter vibrioides]
MDMEGAAKLALALPEVLGGVGETGYANFDVGGKAMAWSYLARPDPKAARVLVPGVLAVRCAKETKAMLLEAAPERFFTDDHYRTYPAVLVRLEAIEAEELDGLLRGAWKTVAPTAVKKRHPHL